MSEKQIAVVVLAAGASKRMGEPKQLLEVEGDALLRRTVQTALAAQSNWVLVTLGSEAQACAATLDDLNCTLVLVGDWHAGLSRSIRRGLGQIQQHNEMMSAEAPFYHAVLFVPCDLPGLTARHLNALISAYHTTGAPIAASGFGEVIGIPALFDHTVWPEFEQLEGEEGARKIIRRAPGRMQTVEFEAGAVDLDTPQDYRAFLSNDFDHFQHK